MGMVYRRLKCTKIPIKEQDGNAVCFTISYMMLLNSSFNFLTFSVLVLIFSINAEL